MQTLAQIKQILTARGLAPRKPLGQNFLIDQNLIRKLADACEVRPGDRVLEIGPGTGALTEALLERGARVVAAELDRGLAQHLREHIPPRIAEQSWSGEFTLVEGDCLASPREIAPALIAAIGPGPFKLAANLPYGAATPLLLALLIDHPSCTLMGVTIQREVADRLLATPGGKDYGTLGIIAQAVASIERLATLPPECFWPRPDVTSAMVLLRRLSQPLTGDPAGLGKLCQTLFGKRRKQLGAILGRQTPLPSGVRYEQRPEELTISQLADLHRLLSTNPPDVDNSPAAR